MAVFAITVAILVLWQNNGVVAKSMKPGKDFIRPHYGVAFEFVGELIPSPQYWQHTIVYTIPDGSTFFPRYNSDYSEFSLGFRTEMFGLAAKANRIIQLAQSRFPPLKRLAYMSPRSKRLAPLRFTGDISKGLFGTATIGDVQKIATLVNKVAANDVKLSKDIQLEAEHLHSYMQTNNTRMDVLDSEISLDRVQIENLEEAFSHIDDDLKRKLNWTVSTIKWMIGRQSTLNSIRDSLLRLEMGVQSLASGTLSNFIVQDKDIMAVLNERDQLRARLGANFHFLETDPSSYYGPNSPYSVYVNGSDIWITLKLPVGEKRPMQLYRVHTWATPIHKNANESTFIGDAFQEFVAIDYDSYAPLSVLDLRSCVGSKTITCPKGLILRTLDYSSCLSALIRGSSRDVGQLCDFMAVATPLKPQVRPISTTRILVQNIYYITLICGDKENILDGCYSCIMDLPCGCRVKLQRFSYAVPTVGDCKHIPLENTISRKQMFNMAVLRQFLGHFIRIPENFIHHELSIAKTRFKALDQHFKSLSKTDKHLAIKLSNIAKKAGVIANDIAQDYYHMQDTAYVTAPAYLGTTGSFVDAGIIIGMVILLVVGFLYARLSSSNLSTKFDMIDLEHERLRDATKRYYNKLCQLEKATTQSNKQTKRSRNSQFRYVDTTASAVSDSELSMLD